MASMAIPGVGALALLVVWVAVANAEEWERAAEIALGAALALAAGSILFPRLPLECYRTPYPQTTASASVTIGR